MLRVCGKNVFNVLTDVLQTRGQSCAKQMFVALEGVSTWIIHQVVRTYALFVHIAFPLNFPETYLSKLPTFAQFAQGLLLSQTKGSY